MCVCVCFVFLFTIGIIGVITGGGGGVLVYIILSGVHNILSISDNVNKN